MNRTSPDPDYREIIRQRRITAGILLALSLVCFSVLSGGNLMPLGWMLDDDTGAYAAGDPYGEWIYAECDGEQQQITVLKDGHLSGVAGLDSLRTVSLPAWCDLPLIDNQNLGLWDAKLDRLNQVTGRTDTSGVTVLEAALDLPQSSLYLQPVGRWLDADPQHGPELLDAISRQGSLFSDSTDSRVVTANRENLERVINRAMDQALTLNPDQEQIRAWLGSRYINGSNAVLNNLVPLASREPLLAAEVIAHLDDLPQRERRESYLQLALPLVASKQYAPLLVVELKDLPNDERLPMVRTLLARPEADREFAKQLLGDFDDVFYGQQTELEAFLLIADTIQADQDAPYLLKNVLDELPDMERRIAAIHMLDLDRDDETRYTLAVLDEFDELHALSRPRVMEAILRSSRFADPEVQRRSVTSIDRDMGGPEQKDLLREVRDHPQASTETVEAARRALD